MRHFLILLVMAMSINLAGCAQQALPYENVNVEEFEKGFTDNPKAYILDVRTPAEYDAGHIPGAKNLDWLNRPVFDKGAESLPKEDTIYLYCRSGVRSAAASEYLSSLGYKVVNLKGGYMSWETR